MCLDAQDLHKKTRSQESGLQNAHISAVENISRVEVRMVPFSVCSSAQAIFTKSRLTGVPFHPEQEPPHAPCPFCCKNNDDRPKKLLFINGTSKGEYDNEIPDSYFDIPPAQITGPEKGAEGLRVRETENSMSILD